MCLLDVCCLAKWKIEKVTRPTFKGGEIANKTAEKDKIGKKVETNTDINKNKMEANTDLIHSFIIIREVLILTLSIFIAL